MTSTPTGCPGCGAPLFGAPRCPFCDLPLTGPVAARLWEVDQALARLASESGVLQSERVQLLEQLRSPAAVTAAATAADVAPAPAPTRPVASTETSTAQVQNTLLGLGALLLALAGVVFAAVTYRHVGVAGRAGILLALTAAAAAAPAALVARRLTASAEALTCVAVVLAVVDAWALRRAGLADAVQVESYCAAVTALLAGLAAAAARALPLRSARLSALLFAQLPVPFLLARLDSPAPAVAVVLTAVACLDLLAFQNVRASDITALARGLGAAHLLVAVGIAIAGAADHDPQSAWGLLALGAAAALLSVRLASPLLAGPMVPLVAAAAWVASRSDVASVRQPLVLVAVAVLSLALSGLLPAARRTAVAGGALAVAAAAVLTQAAALLLAGFGPLGWFGQPWTRHAGSARATLSPEQGWDGSVVTVLVMLAAAGCLLLAGAVLDRLRDASMAAAPALLLCVAVLPLGLDGSYALAVGVLLVAAAACILAGSTILAGHRQVGLLLLTGGGALTLLDLGWALADQRATLTVLPPLAAVALGASVRAPGVLTAAAALLLGGELAAVGAAQGRAADQIGGLLLVAMLLAAVLAVVLRGRHRLGLEAATTGLAFIAVVLCAGDPGWLSWSLALSGVAALGIATKADRRAVGAVGALLLSASSWVRLADAHIHAPDPYVLPLAAVVLLLGHLRRRSQPELGSVPAYAPGLSLALVPTLLKSLSDAGSGRGLLLLVGATAVLLVGARSRLRAPLLLGGAVLAVDALHLLAPYATALPRWTLLAAAGALLLALGATYEQRLRDVARLRQTLDAWA